MQQAPRLDKVCCLGSLPPHPTSCYSEQVGLLAGSEPSAKEVYEWNSQMETVCCTWQKMEVHTGFACMHACLCARVCVCVFHPWGQGMKASMGEEGNIMPAAAQETSGTTVPSKEA